MLGSLLASGSNATIDSNATVKTQMPQLRVFWTIEIWKYHQIKNVSFKVKNTSITTIYLTVQSL